MTKKTIKHVDEILRELPQTIASAYSAILSRCQEEYEARTLLQIVVAARRPLTVRKLNIAYELVTSGDREAQARVIEIYGRKKTPPSTLL